MKAEGPPEELIIKHEWTILRNILSEFKAVCCHLVKGNGWRRARLNYYTRENEVMNGNL
jgi:hypothetical protein